MKEIILIKNGELALKGLNRSTFEDILVKNIRRRLAGVGKFAYTKAQSTIMIEPLEGADTEKAVEIIGKVFGIAGFSRAAAVEKDFAKLLEISGEYLGEALRAVSTFKVEAKRSDKHFPMKSPEICRELGGHLLSLFPHLKVDVHNPDLVVTAEVRDKYIFLHANQIKGAGGMPVGTGGKAAILISGGIDSPVAAWMMAKRGIELTAVHFASPPYTSRRAEMKVEALLAKVARYSGRMSMITVPFTEIQENIKDNCPEELFTIIMRRAMMMASSMIAKKEKCSALITGESVGQVASQTIYALACTDAAADMPVFRPLIGMDKDEIIEISRKIDTFETSILPYEDCCTVFTPKHPKTRPVLADVIKAEEAIPLAEMVKRAVSEANYKTIKYEE